MQVSNRNSYPMYTTPHFTALKSVNARGLYKKYPELAKELVDAFKKNPDAVDFCKKYDVDLVLHSKEYMNGGAESSIHILFDDISRGKFKKFIDAINGKKEDVHLTSWSNTKWSLEESLAEGTSELREMILPEGFGSSRNGLLSAHLKTANEDIEDKLAQKGQKALKKQEKIAEKEEKRNRIAQNTDELNDSIKDLIHIANN